MERCGPHRTLARAVIARAASCCSRARPRPRPHPTTGYTRPATYGIQRVSDLKIETSDGITLAADVYYPTDPETGERAKGRFPVILAQTPYGKRSVTTTQGFRPYGGDGYFPYLVERGYINAIVDVRGTGSSEGAFGLFTPARRPGRRRARGLGGEAPGLERQGRRGRLLVRRADADAHGRQGRPQARR